MKKLWIILILFFVLPAGVILAQTLKETAEKPFIGVRVPILMYHHVCLRPRVGSNHSIASKSFAEQMRFLKQNGYTSVSLDQIAAAVKGQNQLPSRSVSLTFDDGWKETCINVMPVLQLYDFKATFFVITGYSDGCSAYISWHQIKDMRDAGMWIGSHSIAHSYLKRLNSVALEREISKSKAIIEARTEGLVTIFAYPYGGYNCKVINAVQRAGYVAAVAADESGILHNLDQIYRLKRIEIGPETTLEQFKTLLGKEGLK